MSYWYGKAKAASTDSFAGGVASIGDIFSAARDQALYVDNSYAATAAMDRAISERNDEVFAATGVRPSHPFHRSFTDAAEGGLGQKLQANMEKAIADWQSEIATAAGRIPDGTIGEKLNRSIEADAIRIARQADASYGQMLESRPGMTKWIGGLAGGIAGALRDPVQIATLFIGGGPGAGRTVATRLISSAFKEAFINGAAEAALQPTVQAWREKAGLPHGMEEALRNIGFATAFGGVFGLAGQGFAEAGARLAGRSLDTAAEAAIAAPTVKAEAKAALAGDAAAARALLPEIRQALPPEARGALDHAEALRRQAISPEAHDQAITAAHRIIEDPAAPGFKPDERQIARISDELMPAVDPSAPRPQSLTEFLAARGGVLDDKGELKAIGAEKLSKKPKKRGETDRRIPLDMAREAAEEAGYIGRAGEVQTTTVADLLDAIDADLRGNRIFARDADPSVIADIDAERGRVESVVAQVAAEAGPAVDDAIVRQAAELALRDNIDPGDALERVMMRGGDAPDGPAARAADDVPPGWSDAELEAASARRGEEPSGADDTPFDDAGDIDPAYEITPRDIAEFGDMMVPGDDGPVSLASMMDDIALYDDFAAIVKACRI